MSHKLDYLPYLKPARNESNVETLSKLVCLDSCLSGIGRHSANERKKKEEPFFFLLTHHS